MRRRGISGRVKPEPMTSGFRRKAMLKYLNEVFLCDPLPCVSYLQANHRPFLPNGERHSAQPDSHILMKGLECVSNQVDENLYDVVLFGING